MTSISEIQSLCCQEFGLTLKALCGAERTRSISYPRMAAYLLARDYTRHSLASIAKSFGNRNHATVIYGIRKIKTVLQNNKRLDDAYWRVKSKLQPLEIIPKPASVNGLYGGASYGG